MGEEGEKAPDKLESMATEASRVLGIWLLLPERVKGECKASHREGLGISVAWQQEAVLTQGTV